MTDTYWADVSEYQVSVDDTYPYQVLAIRSNDGTYRDNKFAGDLAWCTHAVDSGRMAFFIVYLVYRQNWQQDLDTLISDVGLPHAKMVVMIDVESWGGQVTGDQSASINAMRAGIGSWLGTTARVGVYANRGDLTTLYPELPSDVRVFVAGYGTVIEGYPQEIAQQYTDSGPCAPFGTCDMNIARNMSPEQVAAAFGIGATGGNDVFDADAQAYLTDLMAKTRSYPFDTFRNNDTGEMALAAPGHWYPVPGPAYIGLYRERELCTPLDQPNHSMPTNEFNHFRDIYLSLGTAPGLDTAQLVKDIAAAIPGADTAAISASVLTAIAASNEAAFAKVIGGVTMNATLTAPTTSTPGA